MTSSFAFVIWITGMILSAEFLQHTSHPYITGYIFGVVWTAFIIAITKKDTPKKHGCSKN